MGFLVGATEGLVVGTELDGLFVGERVGWKVGVLVGVTEGLVVGTESDGLLDGSVVGETVGKDEKGFFVGV